MNYKAQKTGKSNEENVKDKNREESTFVLVKPALAPGNTADEHMETSLDRKRSDGPREDRGEEEIANQDPKMFKQSSYESKGSSSSHKDKVDANIISSNKISHENLKMIQQ